jgi:Zn-dependent protease with chaperone function
MDISKIHEHYENKSFSIFFISLLQLTLIPLFFYNILHSFSGFGFFTINSNFINNIQQFSLIPTFLGCFIPLCILVASFCCGLNRNIISFFFSKLVFLTIYGLIIYLISIISIFFFFFFFLINELFGLKVFYIIIGFIFSFSFIFSLKPIILGINNFINIKYINRIGVRLDKVNHSKIISLINKIAKKIKAVPPKNIIIGLSTDFYVLSKDVKLFNGVEEKLLKGETLYISIPFLRVLTIKELEGIIGHELAHFSGEDTNYTLKFAPYFRRLTEQFISFDNFLKKSNDQLSKLFSTLSVYPLIFLYIEFSRKEQKISKIQELRADKFASEACGDSKIFINAVCKLYVYDLVWQNIEKDYYEMVRNKVKNKIKNLSLDFIRTIRSKVDKSQLEVYLKEIYKNEQKHPSDTHPTIEQRMKNLKVNKKDINNKSLTNFLPSAASLIDNIDIVEENLTLVFNEIAKRETWKID